MPRKRRPPEPHGRSSRASAPGLHPAGILAWLILLAGLTAFGHTVYRQARSPGSAPVATAAAGARPAPGPVEPAPVPRREPVPGRGPAPPTPPPHDLLVRPAPAPSRTRPDPAPRRGRLAIIIDDVGQDLHPVERLTRMRHRLTLAVIPHLPHSRQAAEIAHRRGFEVMLHLPMEPLDYPAQDPGPGAIRAGMDAAEIHRTVLANLAAVPHARGVNNHMGSRITAEPRPMQAVLETLATTPCYFVDSRTTVASVAYRLARELRVPAAERTVFLDDRAETQSVRAQLREAVRLARERGQAIAIGHPHPVTLEVLGRDLRGLADSGVALVFVSELVS